MQTVDAIIKQLNNAASPASLEGMKRFGIDTAQAIGVSIPTLRNIAKKLRYNHELAQQLWNTQIHEARILASMVDDPAQVTIKQITAWVNDFNSWDICDQVCGNLFDRTPHVAACVTKFSTSKKEFVKRAAFTLMAGYAVHNKPAPDAAFKSFLLVIEREAYDGRNFVMKAVNWALRGIGKRNAALHIEAIKTAERILTQDSKSARWVASNALKELHSDAIKMKVNR